ncbi:MAG: signal peptidase II [Dehalococcoidia bacterium]|nr:signal peptidase II [Dehalococcoidia bacterium]
MKRDALFLLSTLAVIALDQFTKELVRDNMYPGQSIPPDALVRITYVTNTGGAFGILQGQSLFILITTFVGVAAILMYYLFPPINSWLLTTALGLQFGGAIGNLIDRIRLGHVTDFFDFRVWPVFNVADSAIVTGVAVLAFFVFFIHREGAPVDTPKIGSPPE